MRLQDVASKPEHKSRVGLLRIALLLVLAAWMVSGCRDMRAGAASARAANFALACDAAETSGQATLFCTRIDTRNGDVRQIDLQRIPRSNGPTAAADLDPGSYQLVCRAAGTDRKSDYRCVRLNVHTGELLLINLQAVGIIPAAE